MTAAEKSVFIGDSAEPRDVELKGLSGTHIVHAVTATWSVSDE
jgi:hypothetical protein